MSDFINQTFYGNSIREWLIAAGIIVAAVIVGKIIYWIFNNIARRLTAKSNNLLDDIFVDMIEEPLVVSIVISGIWIGLKTLNLPASVHTFVGHVVQFLIVMMVGWLVVRLLDALYVQYLLPLAEKTENDLDDQIMPIVRKGTKLTLWLLTIIVGLNNAGYDVAALIAGLGIGGLALAMAAKDTVANFFGGVTIFTDKPFKLNDRIKVSGFDGSVKEIGIRSTRLQLLDGRIVTMPNSKFADSPVENISLEPSRKITLDLGLTYDTSPDNMEKAMEILQRISDENVDTEENNVIFFSGFGDFAINIKFIYYIKKGSDIAGVQNGINLSILREFNKEGLEFAFPTQTLYNIDAQAEA